MKKKMNELLGRFLNDFGGTFHSALAVIGDKLGLYKAMAEAGPLTSEELAKRTGTTERYVREWLASQAAGGYATYDAATGRFFLTEEQAVALTDENGPVFLPGAFQLALSVVKSEPRIETAFKTGEGVGWHEHDARVVPRNRTLLQTGLRRKSCRARGFLLSKASRKS
mgnify:CR=1 FL=1